MSKKVCICGNDHGKEKPLVITITTCKNRHSRVEANPKSKSKGSDTQKACTAACSSLSTIKNDKKSSKVKETDSGTIDNLKYSSEEGCPGPGPKGRGEPLTDDSECCVCHSKGDKKKSKKDKKKKKSEEVCPGPNCIPQPVESACCECGKNKKKDKKKKDKKKDKKKKDKKKKSSSCDSCCNRREDKSHNCPSQAQVKLPILVPRYHGPGCAMEVNVLEKHDKSCRLKKVKNPKRHKTDDRSGSYEVIGRIIFKTCQPALPQEPPCKTCPQTAKLATIYSLFNIPQDYRETCDVDLSSKTNKERMRFLQKYLKHQRVLENLAKSSKSFPTNLNKYDVLSEVDNFRKIDTEGCRSFGNNNSYEVEEIYVSETKSNQSIQMSEKDSEKSSNNKLRRWMYFFFPCLFSYESCSSFGCSDLDMEYKNRRYEYMV